VVKFRLDLINQWVVGNLHKYQTRRRVPLSTSPRPPPATTIAMNSTPLPDQMPPPSLSRTSSSTSFSSEDDGMSSSTVTIMNSSRRTRKRFTNAQLTMLENLFHQNSHPSREDREAVAKAGGMSVTHSLVFLYSYMRASPTRF